MAIAIAQRTQTVPRRIGGFFRQPSDVLEGGASSPPAGVVEVLYLDLGAKCSILLSGYCPVVMISVSRVG